MSVESDATPIRLRCADPESFVDVVQHGDVVDGAMPPMGDPEMFVPGTEIITSNLKWVHAQKYKWLAAGGLISAVVIVGIVFSTPSLSPVAGLPDATHMSRSQVEVAASHVDAGEYQDAVEALQGRGEPLAVELRGYCLANLADRAAHRPAKFRLAMAAIAEYEQAMANGAPTTRVIASIGYCRRIAGNNRDADCPTPAADISNLEWPHLYALVANRLARGISEPTTPLPSADLIQYAIKRGNGDARMQRVAAEFYSLSAQETGKEIHRVRSLEHLWLSVGDDGRPPRGVERVGEWNRDIASHPEYAAILASTRRMALANPLGRRGTRLTSAEIR